MAAGLSLAELGKRTFYTKGYLSKVENEGKPPGQDLARRCDAALSADGELAALVTWAPPETGQVADLPRPGPEAEFWVGAEDIVIGVGDIDAAAWALLEAGPVVFDTLRGMGHQAPPAAVLPPLVLHSRQLAGLARRTADPGQARRLWALGARYAEYTGWMMQELGDPGAAWTWTQRSRLFADHARVPDAARYALVRHAELAFYRDDAKTTVELARQARASTEDPGLVDALALQWEAKGHALSGAQRACLQALESAALLRESQPATAPPGYGPQCLPDPVSLDMAWSLHELGRPADAAEILDRVVPQIPPEARRSTARFGVRRALMHATLGEVEHACQLAAQTLAAVRQTESSTVRLDLGRLTRVLARRHTHPAVRELYPQLTATLHHDHYVGTRNDG